MKNIIISFVVSALIGLGFGYVIFDVLPSSNKSTEVVMDNEKATEKKMDTKKDSNTVSSDGGILAAKSCLQCHSVSALNLKGGTTGPDLSQAYNNVEGKHGKPIDQFLKKPTSAVMSGVIGGSPLSDEEIKQVLDLLKQASQAK